MAAWCGARPPCCAPRRRRRRRARARLREPGSGRPVGGRGSDGAGRRPPAVGRVSRASEAGPPLYTTVARGHAAPAQPAPQRRMAALPRTFPHAPAPPTPHPLRSPRARGMLDFGSPLRRATDTLLVANALCFAAQWLSRDALTLWGAKVNSLVAAGQLWRLLTSSLLHTSLIHLLVRRRACISPPRPPGAASTRPLLPTAGACYTTSVAPPSKHSRTASHDVPGADRPLPPPPAPAAPPHPRSTATRCTPSGRTLRWSAGLRASWQCTPRARSPARPRRSS